MDPPLSTDRDGDYEKEPADYYNCHLPGQQLLYGLTLSPNPKTAGVLGFHNMRAAMTYLDTQGNEVLIHCPCGMTS